jgi:hypothetical protein
MKAKSTHEIQVFERASEEMVQSFSGITILFLDDFSALLRLKARSYVWIDAVIIKFTTTEEILSIDSKHHARGKKFTYMLKAHPPYRMDDQGRKHPLHSWELSHCCRHLLP